MAIGIIIAVILTLAAAVPLTWYVTSSNHRKQDAIKVDSAEAEHMTGEKDLEKAAKILAGYGPKEIVLTQKKEILVYADGKFYRAPFLPKNLSGRTGRGDTCITSYIGSRLKYGPERACQIAGIITSMKPANGMFMT